jgi:hypothetical protein|tara:strand:+ start:3299 stop:3511 length:213 start_codon:yes stop_codon:yes gene_type:complete
MTKFNLSEKIINDNQLPMNKVYLILEEDVKEFIKRLRKRINMMDNINYIYMNKVLDELAGEKLKGGKRKW